MQKVDGAPGRIVQNRAGAPARKRAMAINRRAFLQSSVAAAAAAMVGCGTTSSVRADPLVLIQLGDTQAAIPFLAWDTEGGNRLTNLLRAPAALRIQVSGAWGEAVNLPTLREITGPQTTLFRIDVSPNAHILWEIDKDDSTFGFRIYADGKDRSSIENCELVLPFDPTVTPTAVLPSDWTPDGMAILPAVISAPDFGQMVLSETSHEYLQIRLEGDRNSRLTSVVLELPKIQQGNAYNLSFVPLRLPAPEGLHDAERWQTVRRSWFNCWQPSFQWGDQNGSYSAPAGILANNVISDVVSYDLPFHADHALWVPNLAPGISIMATVRHTIEWWLQKRTLPSGAVIGYWAYSGFLDANPGILIAAWDYVEATGDMQWLSNHIQQLESVSEYLALRDVNGDGIVEATQSGDYGSLDDPSKRSSNWYDAINFGYQDGYANALIYRAWRCLAEMEAKLGRPVEERRYSDLAGQLKTAYSAALMNPQTGWLACWRSEDGILHDYASPVVNGLAIEYGLVGQAQGRVILSRLWQKIHDVRFARFDLGIPSVLMPVRAVDYIPEGFGTPLDPDGHDTFQHYENGGITAGQTLHFLAAHYLVGLQELADTVLYAMLERLRNKGFQNGVQDQFPLGIDWTTWDGSPCGYEGFLSDTFAFQQALLLRDARFRMRYYRPLFANP